MSDETRPYCDSDWHEPYCLDCRANQRLILAPLDEDALRKRLTHRYESDGTPCQMTIGSGKRGVLPVCSCGLDGLIARLLAHLRDPEPIEDPV